MEFAKKVADVLDNDQYLKFVERIMRFKVEVCISFLCLSLNQNLKRISDISKQAFQRHAFLIVAFPSFFSETLRKYLWNMKKS